MTSSLAPVNQVQPEPEPESVNKTTRNAVYGFLGGTTLTVAGGVLNYAHALIQDTPQSIRDLFVKASVPVIAAAGAVIATSLEKKYHFGGKGQTVRELLADCPVKTDAIKGIVVASLSLAFSTPLILALKADDEAIRNLPKLDPKTSVSAQGVACKSKTTGSAFFVNPDDQKVYTVSCVRTPL